MTVALIDYGSGNLHSAAKAFERAAREAGTDESIVVTSDPDAVAGADRIVLPGVGAFADCRRGLDATPGLVEAVTEAAIGRGRPFLGICVGMQLMADRGLEKEPTAGLGWIRGDVGPLRLDDPSLKVPHMGWNVLHPQRDHPLTAGVPLGPGGLHAYFVHSYALAPADADDLVAVASHGGPVTAVVARGNVAGVQFHPEKSQALGLAPVILFPAIDLKEGRCVRLLQGDMSRATTYGDDPAAQAAAFVAQGFEALHVVDLDGAFAGRPMNAAAVEAILAAVNVPVQLGGGVRDMRTLEGWLDKGVGRVIIGTAAVRDPDFVREAARRHPGRVAVGVDAKDGRVAVAGWAETSSLTAEELGRRFEDAGVAALIYTDVSRDGTGRGLNLPMTLALAEAVDIPVIASGGLGSLREIERLLEPDCARLAGAIAGRALYDGRIDPAEALALLRHGAPAPAAA